MNKVLGCFSQWEKENIIISRKKSTNKELVCRFQGMTRTNPWQRKVILPRGLPLIFKNCCTWPTSGALKLVSSLVRMWPRLQPHTSPNSSLLMRATCTSYSFHDPEIPGRLYTSFQKVGRGRRSSSICTAESCNEEHLRDHNSCYESCRNLYYLRKARTQIMYITYVHSLPTL